MYHISNLGSFAGNALKRYADIDGYIPEVGDSFEEFNYVYPNDLDESWIWEEWVADAVEATAQGGEDYEQDIADDEQEDFPPDYESYRYDESRTITTTRGKLKQLIREAYESAGRKR